MDSAESYENMVLSRIWITGYNKFSELTTLQWSKLFGDSWPSLTFVITELPKCSQLPYDGRAVLPGRPKLNNTVGIFAEGRSLEALYYHYTEYTSNQTTAGRPGGGGRAWTGVEGNMPSSSTVLQQKCPLEVPFSLSSCCVSYIRSGWWAHPRAL